MTDEQLELEILKRYVEHHDSVGTEAAKCERELDMRQVISSITGTPTNDETVKRWYVRLAPPRPYPQGILRPCSISTLNKGPHRFHARAFYEPGRAPAWDRIRELEKQLPAPLTTEKEKEQQEMVKSQIRLFISHSSKDSEFVEALIELLRVALSLPSSQIRCTTIDGYRLPGGANTDQQLKQEVHESDSFIGVISSESIKSLYVAFELGARWGAGRPLIPLITPGTDSKILGGPLTGINALNAGNKSQLHQLISNLSTILDIQPEPPAVYEHKIHAILKAEDKSPPQKVKTIFGTDVTVQGGFHLVYAQLALPQQQNSNGKPITHPFVKPGEESSGTGFSIQGPVSSCELRAAKYLSELIGREVYQSPLLSSDFEIRDKLNISFISFGRPSSNFKSRDALRNDGNKLIKFDNSTFTTYRTNRPVIRHQQGFDYGLILKINPTQFPEKTWIICAGIGEWGTSGASWYLANKWKELFRFAKGEAFAIIVKVRNLQDESSEPVVRIKSPEDAESYADQIG
jgi:hypothetical protein